jgi:dTDP-4-amino-4,6-dideoxygalactose transaminase
MTEIKIPFNKPYLCGNELKYIQEAVQSGKISGDGIFTKKCHDWFEQKYKFKKCFLTTSCTDALEMCAILIDIREGDEVIMPSYTFVSTANAFVLRGAKIIFADSYTNEPNMDATQIEALITPKTKAIVAVHYAGVACDMDKILDLAKKYNLYVIEDAAQAIDSYYKGRPLGSIGHLAAFSFHETKNIISGEGGMLVVNDERFVKRAEIIREKGTNRSQFFRGEVDKYSWVDIGSSFLPSDIIAAFLYAQLEQIEPIQKQRKHIWETYHTQLKPLAEKGYFNLPHIPEYATNNYHMFYIICKNLESRTALVQHLKSKGILAVFHYLPLEQSTFYKDKHDGRHLPNSEHFADTLLRLPLYYTLSENEQQFVIQSIKDFFTAQYIQQ